MSKLNKVDMANFNPFAMSKAMQSKDPLENPRIELVVETPRQPITYD